MNNLLITISDAIEIIEQNFQCPIGNTLIFNLAFKKEDGDPQPITDWKIFFTAKLSKDLVDDASGVVAKTATITDDGTEGLATVELSKEETTELSGVYFYDITYLDNDGNKKLVVEGKIFFRKVATQRDEEIT